MRKQSMVQAWRVVLAAAALIATLMALYVQAFERRSRPDEDRLAASRLVEALEESRARLKTEILAELRAEIAKGEPPEPGGDRPLPGAVLRRSESSGDRVLQQVLTSEGDEADLLLLAERVDRLTRRADETEGLLRRSLEEVRAEVRREREAAGDAVTLLLVAVISLVAYLLTSLAARRSKE